MAQKPKRSIKLQSWYESKFKDYEDLANEAAEIIRKILIHERVPFLSVTSRRKSLQSVIEKNRRKKYKDPQKEITDFAGIRVITYIGTDARRACESIKQHFAIDDFRSHDKLSELNYDQVGYLSYHYVCSLTENRLAFPELENFRGLVFEVQVRTVLQHAWAEIEHDRNYKFSGVLPAHLQRRLYLIAGLLEVGDQEFNRLAIDIDEHRRSVESRARVGDLSFELDTTSFIASLPHLQALFPKLKITTHHNETDFTKLLHECAAFGLKTFADLKALATPNAVTAISTLSKSVSIHGIVRDLMILNNYQKYFDQAWQKNHWSWTEPDSLEVWCELIPRDEIIRTLETKNIDVLLVEDDGSVRKIHI